MKFPASRESPTIFQGSRRLRLSGNRAVTERIKPVFMGTENENQNRHLNLSNTIRWSGI